MKAAEKELIFNLLKKASDNYYGYSSPEFKQMPQFQDDPEICAADSEKDHLTEKNQAVSALINETPQVQLKNDEKEAVQNQIPVEQNSKTVSLQPVFQPEKESGGITLKELAEKIKLCQRCKLHNNRTKAVPGMGVEGSPVLVIGEGPGEEEDKQGLPFVGPAGQLLDKMLYAIQLDRNKNCYIANIVKCRPPYNRDPQNDEASACKSFLDAQIHILKPKMILALGKTAVRNLLQIQGDFSLNKYRGQIYEYNNIPVIVTYHPSALLRNIDFKKPAWEDLKFFKNELLKIQPDYAEEFLQ